MSTDASYSDVVLLLLARGADGSTTITDNSPTPKTATAFNGAAISTAWAKYGTGSLAFDGVNDYITVDHSAQLVLGAGDFAIDVLGKATSTTGDCYLISKDVSGTYNSWAIYRSGTSLVLYASSNGTGWDIASGVAIATITAGADFNIAVNRTGTAWKTYSNGVLTSSFTSSAALFDDGSKVFIGSDAGAASFFSGNLIIRVTKHGRYPAAYTPDTEEFSDGTSAGFAALICPVPLVSGGSAPASATAAITMPSASARGNGGANAEMSMPVAAMVGYGGANASLTVGSFTLLGTAHNSLGDNAAFISTPMAVLSGFCGGNGSASMPMGKLAAGGTSTALANAALTAPAALVSATGTGGASASANLSIGEKFSVIGYGGAIASLSIGSFSFSINATGTSGSVGNAALTLPMFELSAAGTLQARGDATLLMPSPRLGGASVAWLMMPGAVLTAIGSAVVVPAYEAYAVNLNHSDPVGQTDEVTRYTNYPFTHIVRYRNSYFGAGPGGLYLLEGITDDGQAIDYAVKTCATDFKKAEKKTVASAYFGGRLGPAATLTLFAGEAGQEAYGYSTPRGQIAQNHREKFGRGVKDRYFAIGVSGSDVMELDALELQVNVMTRRI